MLVAFFGKQIFYVLVLNSCPTHTQPLCIYCVYVCGCTRSQRFCVMRQADTKPAVLISFSTLIRARCDVTRSPGCQGAGPPSLRRIYSPVTMVTYAVQAPPASYTTLVTPSSHPCKHWYDTGNQPVIMDDLSLHYTCRVTMVTPSYNHGNLVIWPRMNHRRDYLSPVRRSPSLCVTVATVSVSRSATPS